jgi:hypothetical protein
MFQPVQLILARLVARPFHVVHVQHEALGRRRRIGPRQRRRGLVAGLGVFDGNLAAIGE